MVVLLILALGCGAPRTGRPTALEGHATPTPPQPVRWLAIGLDAEGLAGGGLEIARIAGDRIVTVSSRLPGGQFGWLDDHTLLVVEAAAGRPVGVTRYVDGKRAADPTTIPEQQWPHQDFVELALTHRNEAWISKCVLHGNECGDERLYLRVAPFDHVEAKQAPDDVDAGRASDGDANPWPLPPTVPAPADAHVSVSAAGSVTCELHGTHSQYPAQEADADNASGSMSMFEIKRSVRWVSATPAIYEIAEDTTNPAGDRFMHYVYATPCRAPFDGYASLGDDLWASFALASHDSPYGRPGEPPREDGDWTVHRGNAVIGTLHGTARLRANLSEPAPPAR